MSGARLVYGVHAVSALIGTHPEAVTGLWVDAERHDAALAALRAQAAAAGINTLPATRSTLDSMTEGARHQGIVARRTPESAWDERRLLDHLAALTTPALLLVLDGVEDPHNLGACLRSADAAGAHAVVVPRDRAAGLNPTVRKVASGAAEYLPVVPVTNLARTLRAFKEAGVWLVGAAAEAATDFYATDLTPPTALVLGGEGQGLRRLTRACCDHVVHIPMYGHVESLNVSVAAGVMLFETVRQRRARSHGAVSTRFQRPST